MSHHHTASDLLAWLASKPGLVALCEACPDDWAQVQQELAGVFERRDPAELKAVAERAAARLQAAPNFLSGERDGRAFAALVQQQVRQRMTDLAIRQYAFASATGVHSGKARFNFYNGFVLQRLLFAGGLKRKPVGLRVFHLVWPLITQKRLLMPLVEKRGIYCFFSRELIAALAQIIGTRTCSELAAGDGTLSRFLRAAGVDVRASDDGSWSAQTHPSDDVARLDAVDALRQQQPEVAICCWPPANNRFERQVFRTRSVQTYIVIGSRSQFMTGNWADYRSQTLFDMQAREDLARLVLPPGLGAMVWVFERRVAEGAGQ
ncbi:hypothetical protein [Chitinimonas sp. BJYL2]|uniref:hypothetical protein n=1 Tax=Chitinimonas sp. BJYL2 TaxID=2976696 RepID=UPI0022B2C73B|nr:hypothetical protein [Chitinimonas sp. BJYL2]